MADLAQFSTKEVLRLQEKLKEIDASRVNGKFVDKDGKEYSGSDTVSELLSRCLTWSDIVLDRYVLSNPQCLLL